MTDFHFWVNNPFKKDFRKLKSFKGFQGTNDGRCQ